MYYLVNIQIFKINDNRRNVLKTEIRHIPAFDKLFLIAF